MNTVEHTKGFEIEAPMDDLFPLFSPEGEKSWVPGWDYENIMGSTDLSEDYVFLTTSHDHGSTRAIWVVKRYEPADGLVEFYKVEPEDKVGTVTVQCTKLDACRTHVQVSYRYVALSEKGRSFIRGFDRSAYDDFMREWKNLLSAYFSDRSP